MIEINVVLVLLLTANLIAGTPFIESREYNCFAGPHRFQLQTNTRGAIFVSRYLLSDNKYLSMPPYESTGQLQWHTLDSKQQRTSLLRLHADTMELNIAWLDDDGSLLRSDRHFAECQQG